MTAVCNSPFIGTKEKILLNALDLFANNGYEAVSVKDIAERMSLTKAALYKHYKSKRDIFDTIVIMMAKEDAVRAEKYQLPVDTLSRDPEGYRKTQLESLLSFTEAQFRYFTIDPFASRFRRMLTLEQYRDSEMTELYQQYLCAGPLGYTADIFTQLIGNTVTAFDAAVEFYAPVFMLYSLYDGTADKSKPYELLKTHITYFKNQFYERE